MEQFIKVLKSFGRVSADLADDLLQNCVRQEVKKGDLIQTIGHPIDQMLFVEKGLLMYFQFRKGKKYILDFKPENRFALLLFDIKPMEDMTLMGVEALEDGVIWSFASAFLQGMYRKHLEFNRHVMVMAQNELIEVSEQTRLFREKSAVEWNLYFKETAPSLLQRVPVEDMADYMGIPVRDWEYVVKKRNMRLNMVSRRNQGGKRRNR